MKIAKFVAAGGAALMVAGMAAPAMAAPGDRGRDRDSRPGECSVALDTYRGRDLLHVDVDASRRADSAVARIDFDSRRGDVLRRVDLDRRGDGSLQVQIPRRADRVRVTVFVREGRGLITCSDTLNLRRGGPRTI